MNNRHLKIVSRTGLAILFLICSLAAFGQNAKALKPARAESPPTFRYIIVSNEIDNFDRRVVQVLMDEKAFSEQNLRTLFSLVSKRFPNPDELYVNLATSLEQLRTPEEMDQGAGSSRGEPPTQNLWAIYLRDSKDEYFRFSPVNDRKDNKLVQLTRQKE